MSKAVEINRVLGFQLPKEILNIVYDYMYVEAGDNNQFHVVVESERRVPVMLFPPREYDSVRLASSPSEWNIALTCKNNPNHWKHCPKNDEDDDDTHCGVCDRMDSFVCNHEMNHVKSIVPELGKLESGSSLIVHGVHWADRLEL